MTTEKTLENIIRIADRIKDGASAVALMFCEELIDQLKAEINTRETMRKAEQNGQKDMLAGALKILQSTKKCNPIFKKALTAPDGSQIITDGFRAVKLYSPLDLPVHDAANRYAAESVAAGIDRIIMQAAQNRGETIKPLDGNALKNLIATQKAEMKARGDKTKIVALDLTPEIRVDACLLVDLLRVLPGATLITSANKVEPWRRPVYLKAENGCGVLLPLFKGESANDKT